MFKTIVGNDGGLLFKDEESEIEYPIHLSKKVYEMMDASDAIHQSVDGAIACFCAEDWGCDGNDFQSRMMRKFAQDSYREKDGILMGGYETVSGAVFILLFFDQKDALVLWGDEMEEMQGEIEEFQEKVEDFKEELEEKMEFDMLA